MLKYRADIDGLRAIAVLLVVIYHFKNDIGFNGYMGVDIFFVISGFLITKIIYGELQNHSFTLSNFYERRVRRIFPALFAVVFVSMVVAVWLLLPKELLGFSKSAIASLFFSSNILFYSEAGYFDSSADLKPLLHTWSLAVEEQFYIVFPLILAALMKYWRRRLAAAVIAILAFSFISAVFIEHAGYDIFAFYMFPVRAWELMAGSLIALGVIPSISTAFKKRDNLLQLLSILGFSLIVVGVAAKAGKDDIFALSVAPVVIGTAMLIYAGQFRQGLVFNRLLSHPFCIFFGKISYSLYLWHWPVYVFAKYYMLDDLSNLNRVFLIGVSIILAYVSWRFIEQPFRQKTTNIFSMKNLSLGFGIIVFIVMSGGFLIAKSGVTPWHSSEAVQVAAVDIGGRYPRFEKFGHAGDAVIGVVDKVERSSAVLWGDSHAHAISPAVHQALLKQNKTGLLLRNNCLALSEDVQNYPKFTDCATLTKRQMAYINELPDVDTVVLAQRWVSKTINSYRKLGVDEDEKWDLRYRTLSHIIRDLQQTGKNVVILAQVPLVVSDQENIPSLYVRMKRRDEGATLHLFPTLTGHLAHQEKIISIFNKVKAQYPVQIIWPHQILCDENKCHILDEGGFYYYDDDHLSHYGALKIAPLFQDVF